jgi:hypothetical protein
MEKRITLIKNFISVDECNILLNKYKNELDIDIQFLNKKLDNYLKKIKFIGSDLIINNIKFYSISTENINPIFLNESEYDITLLIGLNSDFEGGRFIFLNKEIDKNLHMDNSPGDMIIFFSNIQSASNKIISGTKYYLKININNILNQQVTKSLI